MSNKKLAVFYDIETTPLKAWVWRLGETVLRHGQLDDIYDGIDIICITYCFNDGKPAKCLSDPDTMIQEFDAIVNKCDISIGKNSARFDVKHINTQRFLKGLPPVPSWTDCSDDLEAQIRKYFAFPSNTLDYLSKKLGLGGKNKMEMEDWVHIVNMRLANKIENVLDKSVLVPSKLVLRLICPVLFKRSYNSIISLGKIALDKMIVYGLKDTEDTRALWRKVERYIVSKKLACLDEFNVGDKCRRCDNGILKSSGSRHLASSITHLRYRSILKCSYCGKKTSGKILLTERDK